MRIRALPEALAQTALLQITDLGTGAFQRTSFTISQSGNAPLAAVPNRISFTGPDTLNCATGLVADVIVFGGRPPYQITQPGSVASVSPNVVSTNGGRFSVTANGGCATDASIGIVDSVGATTTVTVSNVLGTVEVTPELIVSPTTVSLAACTDIASVLVAGGTGQFSAATGSGSLQAPVAGSTVSISRARPSSAPGITSPQTLQVFVSDGKTVRTVTVTLTGAAATSACAAP
jgi:hypothetical protein